MPTDANVRLLTPTDIPAALALSRAAGWNQTEADWRLLLDLAPEGCLGLTCDGRLAATATLVCYGAMLAWIGMVLTDTEYRRRGFARILMSHLLETAAARGIATVKLDATDLGRPLYAALGFREEQPVERWVWEGEERHALPGCVPELPAGVDRSELLRRLAGNGGALVEGPSYLLHRPGDRAHYLGPCVANTFATARDLFRHALRQTSATRYYWDLLPSNRAAVKLARELGFAPVRRLTRMVRGADLRPPDESNVYAIAGFEWG